MAKYTIERLDATWRAVPAMEPPSGRSPIFEDLGEAISRMCALRELGAERQRLRVVDDAGKVLVFCGLDVGSPEDLVRELAGPASPPPDLIAAAPSGQRQHNPSEPRSAPEEESNVRARNRLSNEGDGTPTRRASGPDPGGDSPGGGNLGAGRPATGPGALPSPRRVLHSDEANRAIPGEVRAISLRGEVWEQLERVAVARGILSDGLAIRDLISVLALEEERRWVAGVGKKPVGKKPCIVAECAQDRDHPGACDDGVDRSRPCAGGT